MNNPLELALSKSSRIVEQALAEARAELAALDERRRELVEQISQAEAVQQSHHTPNNPGRDRMTLHQAIEVVLTEQDNRWMTVRELANEVNHRNLYQKKDGSKIEANQIHARTKNYDQIFEKNGPDVRLRPS